MTRRYPVPGSTLGSREKQTKKRMEKKEKESNRSRNWREPISTHPSPVCAIEKKKESGVGGARTEEWDGGYVNIEKNSQNKI